MKIETIESKLNGLCAIVALAVCGCSRPGEPPEPRASTGGGRAAALQSPAELTVSAKLNPTAGHDVMGTVTFTQEEDGVRVVARISGLPEGEHGFHIHESGDCSAPDAASAGGHFNPTGMPHGGPESEKHHVGDLGNIAANASGEAYLDRVFPFLELSGKNSIVGRGLIVHAGKDDTTSQPSGNAGDRVACGVIKSKAEAVALFR